MIKTYWVTRHKNTKLPLQVFLWSKKPIFKTEGVFKNCWARPKPNVKAKFGYSYENAIRFLGLRLLPGEIFQISFEMKLRPSVLGKRFYPYKALDV